MNTGALQDLGWMLLGAAIASIVFLIILWIVKGKEEHSEPEEQERQEKEAEK